MIALTAALCCAQGRRTLEWMLSSGERSTRSTTKSAVASIDLPWRDGVGQCHDTLERRHRKVAIR